MPPHPPLTLSRIRALAATGSIRVTTKACREIQALGVGLDAKDLGDARATSLPCSTGPRAWYAPRVHPPRASEPSRLPPPPALRSFPPMTDEQRARAAAHMDELLAHLEPALPDEPDWDVETLFKPGRVR